jgi:hypothetical protein
MPTRSSRKIPFTIIGKVTVDDSAYRGAIVWAKDYGTGGDAPLPVKDLGYAITDELGMYTINLANIQSNFADQDSIRVSCITQNGVFKASNVTVDITAGKITANFTITTKSGLVDGVKNSPLSN